LSLLEYVGLGAEKTAELPLLSAVLGREPRPEGRSLGREELLGL